MSTPTVPPCPECGSTTWTNTEYSSETVALTLYNHDTDGAKIDRDGLRFDAEYDTWTCENDHFADDGSDEPWDPNNPSIAEKLDDLRSTL